MSHGSTEVTSGKLICKQQTSPGFQRGRAISAQSSLVARDFHVICVFGDRVGVRRISNVSRTVNTTRGFQKFLLSQGMCVKVAIAFEGLGLW